MKYIDADLLRKEIDKWIEAMADAVGDYADGVRFALEHFTFVLDSLQQEQPEVDLDEEIEKAHQRFPEVSFAKLARIAKRFYELKNDLSIHDLELLHTFLYAVKNNKQGAFTFTRLSDEQYQEVLRRFKNAK